MKKLLILTLSLGVLGGMMLTSSCDDPAVVCKITQFYWDGRYYDLEYTGSRLDRMVSGDYHIDLQYDEMDRLYTAKHYRPGDGATPSYVFTFTQGTNGITEIDYTGTGEHAKRLFFYTPSGNVDYTVHQEFGALDDEVTFELTQDLTFNGNGNLTFVNATSDVIHTEYTIDQYDRLKNPFMMLAAAVHNPKFFPLGLFTNYPLHTFDVSLGSRFSKNNPHYASYEIPGGVDPDYQEFSHTYTGGLTTSIDWNKESYGTTETEHYEFDYACVAD